MNEKIRRLWPSALFLFLFVAGTVVQFWRPLVGKISISKLHMLAEWDSLFAAQHTGQSMLMDPSLVLLMLPYYAYKGSEIAAGIFPLWNPYSGLGCPFVADPQSLAFSPLHIPLMLMPGLTGWTTVLVGEILILGLSTFALARNLGLSRAASAFACLSIAFCPFFRWQLELLGNGQCFIPLVFWLILRLREKVTAGKIFATGIGCAFMVLSAHPELSAFSIGLASLCLLLLLFLDRENVTNRQRWESVGGLFGAGAIAFCLAAPMILPFLEYLRNSDCYKFGSGAPAVVRWQTLIFDLLQPGFGGGSPTLAAGTLCLVPLAMHVARRNRAMVAILTGLLLFGLAITGKVFPFDLLLSRPPLCYLVVNYLFPSVVLITALLAAFGLDTALSTTRVESEKNVDATISKPALILSLLFAAAAVLLPLLEKPLHPLLLGANYDMCLPDYAFNRHDVLRYSLASLVIAAAIVVTKIKPLRFSALLLTCAAATGIAAEMAVAVKALPSRPPFAYRENIIVPELRKNTDDGKSRFISIGDHLFRPNSNVPFKLSDLRTHNPLFPKRYLQYMTACKAKIDTFNQVFESPVSPLLGLSSVSAVLSHNPVVSTGDIKIARQTKSASPQMFVTIESGTLTSTFTPLIVDADKAAIVGNLAFTALPINVADLTYNLALYEAKDEDNKGSQAETPGKMLWAGPARPLVKDVSKAVVANIPMPPAVAGKEVLLGIQVFNKVTNTWLSPKGNNKKTVHARLPYIFGRLKISGQDVPAAESPKSLYSLAFESPDHLRIYANRNALPRAFAVPNALNVATAEEALAAIQKPDFNAATTVVLEPGTTGAALSEQSTATAMREVKAEKVDIKSLQPNEVTIDVDLSQDNYVVLNDVSYPGWQAQIDGRRAEIKAANFIARAVQCKAGKHQIVFSYKPMSITVGVCLALAATICGLLFLVFHLLKMAGQNRRQRQNVDQGESQPSS